MSDDNTVEYKHLLRPTELVNKILQQKTKFFKTKTEFFRDFEKNMFMELKRDYINEHGIEKYIIEEETIKKEMRKTIISQLKMLFVWNE